MSPRFPLLLFSVFALGIGAQAQETILEEDFESGLPDSWTVLGTLPHYWHLTTPGECGAATQMMAYNVGETICAYPTYSFSTSGFLATPYVQFTTGQPLEVNFDYRLDIDNDYGDVVEVLVVPPDGASWNAYSLSGSTGFTNDGALRSVTFTAGGAHPAVGESFRIEWWFNSDTTGNQGFGWMVDNVEITQQPTGTSYCFGDGSGTPCPCANTGAPGEGCAHSGGHGGILEGVGSASVTLDVFSFQARQLKPNQPTLLFQGNNAINGGIGSPFGDGLRCAGGQAVRLGVNTADGVGETFWGPGLAGAGSWSAGQTRYFQAWFRDPAGSPCGTDFNLTNGSSVTFLP